MDHEKYMNRCLELALQGAGNTAPNPMVGAVLVHDGEIIGEGCHRQFGGPHAEVECIRNVSPEKKHLISSSTLYVSLEPCNHFGKTPPCTDLILENKIPSVVIGCVDVSSKVDGKGIRRLQEAGVSVQTGILQSQARTVNRRFFTFHSRQRPYVILKWAQFSNGIMGSAERRIKISNELTDRLVHKWRSEESAILVGTGTAALDNPALTVRLWQGKNPVRVIIDRDGRLPRSHRVFNDDAPTWVFTNQQEGIQGNVTYINAGNQDDLVSVIMAELHKRNILSLIVEGGARTLDYFMRSGTWDEARVIVNANAGPEDGIRAPLTAGLLPDHSEHFRDDKVHYFFNGRDY